MECLDRKESVGISAVLILALAAIVLVIASSSAIALSGDSDNGILVEEWRYDFGIYFWGFFGASPAIADLGPDVDNFGTDPAADLEIVAGSDDYAPGLWRCFDSEGNLEWIKYTQSDEARGDPVIADLDGDGYLEVAGGTTSGETIEIMDRFGNFVWTFPHPPHAGNFMWDGGPAVADVDAAVSGLEVIASNRARHEIYCLDGDNSDGVDDGYTWTGGYPWYGAEGTDWDIVWIFTVPAYCEIYATPAIKDVDNDEMLEVAFGSTNGVLYVLDALTGGLEASFNLGGAVYASAAIGNLDDDDCMEMVVSSTSGTVYALEWDGTAGITEWTYATGGAVYSSASIGDIDRDGQPEITVGSNDGNIYALDRTGGLEWNYATGGAVYSSPSLACRGPGVGMGIYVGSEDRFLYLLDGTGALVDRFETSVGGYPGFQGIHTSPSIADVDGDGRLEIFFYDWGQENGGHTFWAVEDSGSNVIPYSIEWANFRNSAERTGCHVPCDDEGPITSNVVATLNPAAVNTQVTLTANVDDSTTGNSDIAIGEYSQDGGATWLPMDADDGSYDNPVEDVIALAIDTGNTPGIYTMLVRGTDVAGNVGPADSVMLVVYDPSAGFVTGGGWIMSPEGAYTADPSLTGKANFGFVSRYARGASVPSGNTEFQFHVANLNFHSSAYEWLVVTGQGTGAKFKGTGTINGEGSFKFMVWAGDSDPDTFRIKIWDEDEITAAEIVIYDNLLGAEDDSAQPIDGGSIVIHTRNNR